MFLVRMQKYDKVLKSKSEQENFRKTELPLSCAIEENFI